MQAVALVEQTLREQLQPTKINLAALGNMVPHLHWHVIARFDWDSHFPAPVWAAAQRERDTAREAQVSWAPAPGGAGGGNARLRLGRAGRRMMLLSQQLERHARADD